MNILLTWRFDLFGIINLKKIRPFLLLSFQLLNPRKIVFQMIILKAEGISSKYYFGFLDQKVYNTSRDFELA